MARAWIGYSHAGHTATTLRLAASPGAGQNVPMQIRPMRPDELETVVALWHETCRATYDFIPLEQTYSLSSRRGFFRQRIAAVCDLRVALDADEIVGFMALNGSYLDRLYVRPARQRCGVGVALLACARELSPRGLELHTHQKNTGARAFYERQGFEAARFGVSPPPESEPDVEYRWRPAASDGRPG